MNTGLIIYIVICTGLAIGRLSTVNYSYSTWIMIRFIILAPITIPIYIGSVITLIAEYYNRQINENDNN